ncbi:hypothetical protein CC78DRAFT_586523 [Lojkania enalia]|uniref:Uncharacterized protein n=1 Tax=Lojkania enalia TaxID=147567 RepID=A0A9P4MY73_9PLEO|nr:hypothetical protein CC78DRAFT_586523 [Didymosphaeria enalia]
MFGIIDALAQEPRAKQHASLDGVYFLNKRRVAEEADQHAGGSGVRIEAVHDFFSVLCRCGSVWSHQFGRASICTHLDAGFMQMARLTVGQDADSVRDLECVQRARTVQGCFFQLRDRDYKSGNLRAGKVVEQKLQLDSTATGIYQSARRPSALHVNSSRCSFLLILK